MIMIKIIINPPYFFQSAHALLIRHTRQVDFLQHHLSAAVFFSAEKHFAETAFAHHATNFVSIHFCLYSNFSLSLSLSPCD